MHKLTSNKVPVKTAEINTRLRISVLSIGVNKHLDVTRCLHGLAASLLFVFSIFHLAGATVGDAHQKLLNVVFPFLTDGQVFFMAGILELGISWQCWQWRGDVKAGMMILFFVSLTV